MRVRATIFGIETCRVCFSFCKGNVHPQQLSHDELQRQLQQLKRVILQLEDQLEKQQSLFIFHFVRKNLNCNFFLFAGNNDRKDSPCTSSYIQKQVKRIITNSIELHILI